MKLGFWEKVFTNNGRFKRGHLHYREVCLVNVVLLGLCGVCLFYSFANIFLSRNYQAGVMRAVFSVLAFLLLVYFHRTDNIKVAPLLSVCLLVATLVVFFVVSQNKYYALYWMAVFPPVAFFLLGRRKAILVTSLFCAYMLYFISSKMRGWGPAEFDYKSLLNIAGGTFALVLMVSYFERSRKEAEAALQRTNVVLEDNRNELRLILDSAAEGIYGIDTEGRCTFCNARCLELLGYENDDSVIGKNMHALIRHSSKDEFPIPPDECRILESIRTGETINEGDEIFRRADGTYINVEYYSYPKFKNDEISGAVITFMDISKRMKNEEKIRYLSRHDSLTGLVNRQYFEEQLKNYGDERQIPLSVIFADLNGLKLTNDIFGHTAGDLLIKKAAGILKKNSRENDIIARAGGDEFIMLLPKTDADEAMRMIEKIKDELLKERIHAIKCSMAMGFDTRVDLQQSIEQVMKNAEIEMYREKTLMRKHKGSEMVQDIMSNLHERSGRERMHSETIRSLCGRIGKALGWPEAEVRKLREAGYYHDIGKIVLNDELLGKTDLDTLEVQEKQQHVIAGYRILNLFDKTLDLAETVYYHHENWDGTGYPKGLKGEEIPIQSRIIAVAEQFDFMTSSSNYNPYSKEKALDEIKELSGVKFDPKIVEMFLRTMSAQD